MKKILILGSKPEAVIPADVDYVYAANASAHFYNDNISPSSKLIIVASAGEMYGKDLSKQQKFHKIKNSLRNDLIVAGMDKIPDAQEKIHQEVHVKSIKYYSAKARRELFYKVLGGGLVSTMLLSCVHKRVAPLFFFKYLYHLTRGNFSNADVPGQYRPSTGLFALAYAINKHPENSEYIVSGIGFERRGDYPDRGSVSNQQNPHHLIPDILCFSQLSKRYKVSTTDAVISKQFSVPLLSGQRS